MDIKEGMIFINNLSARRNHYYRINVIVHSGRVYETKVCFEDIETKRQSYYPRDEFYDFLNAGFFKLLTPIEAEMLNLNE